MKQTTLLSACRNNDNKKALEILKSGNFDLRKTHLGKKDGNTALIWACKNKMEDVALYILKHYPKMILVKKNLNEYSNMNVDM